MGNTQTAGRGQFEEYKQQQQQQKQQQKQRPAKPKSRKLYASDISLGNQSGPASPPLDYLMTAKQASTGDLLVATDQSNVNGRWGRKEISPITAEELAVIKTHLVRLKEGGWRLDFTGRNVKELPEWVSSLADRRRVAEALSLTWTSDLFSEVKLEEAMLSRNCLREFPLAVVCAFPEMERLGLGSNEIGSIPDEIGLLRNLEWLDFTHNRVSMISERIGDLPKLASLGASDCRLSSFPLAFTRLRKLRKLGVFNNLITALPSEIGNMRSLTKLDLSGNTLSSLPPEIGNLTALTWLNISNNQLRSLPAELGRCVALKELGLAHNQLTTLPDLGALSELTLLTAFSNHIETLGDWLRKLTKLTRIDFSSNRLQEVPAGILALPCVDLINLRQNQILEIPPFDPSDPTRRSHSLAVLDLRDNRLASLPISVLGPALQDLKVAGNPFHMLPLFTRAATPSCRALLLPIVAGHKHHLHRRLPLQLTSELYDLLSGQRGRVCLLCRRRYVHVPVRWLDLREASDEMAVPFVAELCSPTCRKLYIRNSALSSSSQHR